LLSRLKELSNDCLGTAYITSLCCSPWVGSKRMWAGCSDGTLLIYNWVWSFIKVRCSFPLSKFHSLKIFSSLLFSSLLFRDLTPFPSSSLVLERRSDSTKDRLPLRASVLYLQLARFGLHRHCFRGPPDFHLAKYNRKQSHRYCRPNRSHQLHSRKTGTFGALACCSSYSLYTTKLCCCCLDQRCYW
jgi:hypothetical protein